MEKFGLKPSETTFSAVFSNFDICRPEVADDVISGMVVDHAGVYLLAKFGDSGLNCGRIIRPFCPPHTL